MEEEQDGCNGDYDENYGDCDDDQSLTLALQSASKGAQSILSPFGTSHLGSTAKEGERRREERRREERRRGNILQLVLGIGQ